MANFTVEQLNRVRDLVQLHHWAFVANTMGPETVPPGVLQTLKDKGMVRVDMEWPKDAFTYGHHLAAATDPKFAQMKLAEYHQWLVNNPAPLSQDEINAMQWARENAANNITFMADRVKAQVANEVVRNVQTRGTVKDLKSNLGHMHEDWLRDWDRVAVTEKHNAMQAGHAARIKADFGEDELVFKRPMPDACKHCKRLHLMPGTDIPRIFKLSELEANGTNVGVKVANWKATVGTVHPHCQCQLNRMPAGWGFDEDGEMAPGGKLGHVYEDQADIERAMREEDDLIKAFKLQGRTTFQGLPIAIENKAGTYRKWKDHDGNSGETYMHYAYGYIMGTLGNDEDEVDVYLGLNPRADNAYVVHQQDPDSGIYDEDKVFLGFDSPEQAKAIYQAHYNRPDFFANLSTMPMDHFKRWIAQGKPKDPTLVKSSITRGPRLVIPMRKGLDPVQVAYSDRIGHQNPSMLSGDVTNYLFNIPLKDRPEEDIEMVREHLFGFAREKREIPEGMKIDVESDYGMIQPPPKVVHSVALPDLYEEGVKLDPDTEENRERVKKRRKEIEVPQRMRTKTPIEGDEADHRK